MFCLSMFSLAPLNHQLYLGESFLKYILFNSKLDTRNSELKVVAFPFLDGAREKSHVNYL